MLVIFEWHDENRKLTEIDNSIIHAAFIVLAASAMAKMYFVINRSKRDSQVAKSQADLVKFSGRRGQPPSQPRLA